MRSEVFGILCGLLIGCSGSAEDSGDSANGALTGGAPSDAPSLITEVDALVKEVDATSTSTGALECATESRLALPDNPSEGADTTKKLEARTVAGATRVVWVASRAHDGHAYSNAKHYYDAGGMLRYVIATKYAKDAAPAFSEETIYLSQTGEVRAFQRGVSDSKLTPSTPAPVSSPSFPLDTARRAEDVIAACKPRN